MTKRMNSYKNLNCKSQHLIYESISQYGWSNFRVDVLDEARDRFVNGNFVIYKGPLKDNTGKMVIPAGQSHGQTDLWLESMNWLAEGVIGSATS